MHFSTFPPPLEQWQGFFPKSVLERGRSLMGAVQPLEHSSSTLLAQVQGSERTPYRTLVRSSGAYSCTCPSEVQPCKHVAALLFYAGRHPQAGADWLEALSPEQAKVLLLELATDPLVREKLILRAYTVRPESSDALNAFVRLLERGGNIEHEAALAGAAFAELDKLPAARKQELAETLTELLDGYEIDDDEYDPYDEDTDGYWEDLAAEWLTQAEAALGAALLEAGEVDEALDFLLPRVPDAPELWPVALEAAHAHPQGREQLEEMLRSVRWNAGQSQSQRRALERALIHRYDGPQAYEQTLRAHQDSAWEVLELVNFLREAGQDVEALDLAAEGVRRFGPGGTRFEGGVMIVSGHPADAVGQLLELLRVERPAFEWERVAFRREPTLPLYHALKGYPEFELAREELLRDPMPEHTRLELLLDDHDLPALERLLGQHPTPQVALRVRDFFPERCAAIFKKASLEAIARGNRSAYAEGARWAGEYLALEDRTLGKAWLLRLREDNKRRTALQDEFRALHQRF